MNSVIDNIANFVEFVFHPLIRAMEWEATQSSLTSFVEVMALGTAYITGTLAAIFAPIIGAELAIESYNKEILSAPY